MMEIPYDGVLLPISAFSDVILVAWNWPWKLADRTGPHLLGSQLLNTYQLTAALESHCLGLSSAPTLAKCVTRASYLSSLFLIIFFLWEKYSKDITIQSPVTQNFEYEKYFFLISNSHKTLDRHNIFNTICINLHHWNVALCLFLLLPRDSYKYSSLGSSREWKACQYKYCIS